jgi:ATP-dependent Clp protease ATP-binding subunit ClpA
MHRGPMFERFTNRARHVVVLAQDEARGLQHNYIGTEHLLLGLLGEPGGLGARALERFGMSLAATREEVAALVGTGNTEMKGHIPFTPRAKKVLELALREALQLHHNYIGTEHLLLGLVREGEGVAAQILTKHAGSLLPVRLAVLDLLPATQTTHGRRWLRRHSDSAEEPRELRTTPGADASLDEAARLAGEQPVGSHHLLLAALADPDTAAAKALAALGVDLQQARQALSNADVAGTSDEQPEEAGRRHMLVRASETSVTREATDPAILALGRAALEALGDQADPPGTIRGDLPVSASLGNVWQALYDSLEDIRRRATAAAEARAPSPPQPEAEEG